jgi:nucleoside-diphosphate-sugar epimerase
MKVFVTGGTGALGRFAVPELVRAGHEVTGLARSDEKAAQLERQGARTARVSMFDEVALKEVFAGHDAVCNLATSIPPVVKAVSPRNWAENDRIRQEGSTAVVNAALTAGVERVVQESITFTYPSHGEEWIDESISIDPPPIGQAVVTAEENTARFTREGGIGVVLRFGRFYGPGSDHTDQFLKAAHRHVAPVAGPRDAYQSSIHLVDAATAVVAALALPAGIYNVCDDEPLTRRAYAQALGDAVGQRPWITVPGRMVRISGKQAEIMSRSQRVSNASIKAASNWTPRYPSAREGWKAVVDA